MTERRDVKFRCYRCDKQYTDEDRKVGPYCECGARRLRASFGKIPEMSYEIKEYLQTIFDEAESAFGRTRDQLVYEKAFILLALLTFMCGGSGTTEDFASLYPGHRTEITQTYRAIIKEFKTNGFRTPSSAMPGMAEEEMLGTRPNRLKITMPEYEGVRSKLLNLTAQECQNSIKSLEIQLKNRLYDKCA